MIPAMILFGLVLGRWWRLALAASAVLWPAIVLADGAIDSVGEVIGAVGLGVANAAVGVLAHQAVLQAYRRWPIA
jgi:hypothetical protein